MDCSVSSLALIQKNRDFNPWNLPDDFTVYNFAPNRLGIPLVPLLLQLHVSWYQLLIGHSQSYRIAHGKVIFYT